MTWLIALSCSTFIAQNEVILLNNELNYKHEAARNVNKDNFHSGVKPYIRKDVRQTNDSSNVNYNLIGATIKIFNDGNPKAPKADGAQNLNIQPLIDLTIKGQDENIKYNYAAGLHLTSNIGSKLGVSGIYRYVVDPNFNYLDSSLYIRNAVNGIGPQLSNNKNTHHAELYVNVSPNKYFDITLGNGKHFWGEGYRSMMLSDNAAPYPFIRIFSTFWKVRYTNLYSIHKDNNYGARQNKYATSHQLSWNILKNLNLTIFESVVWAGKDTLVNRGFDVNYLNPIIFYRPNEYLQGSSDNVFLGGSLKYVYKDKHTFYTQVILDEFFLKEIKAQNGWWANKYAVQLGFKNFDFIVSGLSIQLEWNMARPYMYSHLTSLLNYAHEDQSLAHPIGANFQEVVSRIRYQKNKLYLEAKFIYLETGTDSSSVSNGGDIFKPYTQRDREYYHTLSQGTTHYIWHNELRVSYQPKEQYSMRIFGSYAFRTALTEGIRVSHNLFQIGITSNLWNTYTDY